MGRLTKNSKSTNVSKTPHSHLSDPWWLGKESTYQVTKYADARASASASVFPTNIQDWFPLGWTGLISLKFNGLSRVFSNTPVQKHQKPVMEPEKKSSSFYHGHFGKHEAGHRTGGKQDQLSTIHFPLIPVSSITGYRHSTPLQYSWTGKSHGRRSLVGYSPWGR